MMLLVLFVSNVFALAFGKYSVFQNQTIELQYNQIAFFETPDFPLLHNATKFFKYNVTFTTTDSSVNGTRCVLVLQGLSYNPAPFSDVNDVYVFDISSFYLERYNYVLWNYDAFSGYIYFEEMADACPFEMMSRDIPYKFIDENEIIFISSVYKNSTNFVGSSVTQNRTQACKWQFIAPEGYGLKIFVHDFKVLSSTSFRISNSTDLLLTQLSAKSNRPYYYNDEYRHFEITLSKDEHFTSNVEFSAYISVVRQNIAKLDGNCVVSKSESNFTWSTANLTEGYRNDVFCEYEVLVKNNTNILGFVSQLSAEPFVDNLIYFDDQYSYLLNTHYQFLLEPYMNGSDKVYHFKFVSDGSVQASGFVITFIENPCHCNDADILCDNGTWYALLSCDTAYSALTITLAGYTDLDFIKVLSNDIVIYDSALSSLNLSGSVNLYLKSENDNSMVISSVSRGQKKTSFALFSFELPAVDEHVILRENDFSYVLDASVTSFVVVEIEEAMVARNTTLVVYGRNDLICKNNVYNNESLSEAIVFEKCEESSSFYKCRSKVKKMVFFHSRAIVNCFIGFSLSVHPKECVFPSNVYFVQGDKSVVSVMSTSYGQCLATIIKEFDKSFVLSDIFTTAKASNVEIWFGENQETKFLEFNEKTARKWINVLVMSEVYGVKVPSGDILQLTFESANLPFQEQINSAPFNSLITSFHYGAKKCVTFGSEPFITFTIAEVITKFTILDFQPNDVAYFQTSSGKIRINQKGDSFIFKNETVSLYFASTSQSYCGCYINIEAFEKKAVVGF